MNYKQAAEVENYNNICWKILHVPKLSDVRDTIYCVNKNYLLKIFNELSVAKTYNVKLKSNLSVGQINVINKSYTYWKAFESSEYDILFLLEDDAVLSDNFEKNLKNIIMSLPSQWDILILFTHPEEIKNFSSSLEINKYIVKNYQSSNLLCYAVSRTGAKKLINLFNNDIVNEIDTTIFNSDIDIYSINPKIENLVCHISLLFENYELTGKFYKNLLKISLQLSQDSAEDIISLPSITENIKILEKDCNDYS